MIVAGIDIAKPDNNYEVTVCVQKDSIIQSLHTHKFNTTLSEFNEQCQKLLRYYSNISDTILVEENHLSKPIMWKFKNKSYDK